MPFDLANLESGYGECNVEYNGQTVVVRYRADLNNHSLNAMYKAGVGDKVIGGSVRIPNIGAVAEELKRVLLPLDHECGPGWDVTRNGVAVPIEYDDILGLPPELPVLMLGSILRDVRDPNRKRLSSAGSSQTVNSESRRTTTESSEMRNGQASLRGPSPDSMLPATTPAGAAGSGRSAMPRSRRTTS
jgi:hypothetical protein